MARPRSISGDGRRRTPDADPRRRSALRVGAGAPPGVDAAIRRPVGADNARRPVGARRALRGCRDDLGRAAACWNTAGIVSRRRSCACAVCSSACSRRTMIPRTCSSSRAKGRRRRRLRGADARSSAKRRLAHSRRPATKGIRGCGAPHGAFSIASTPYLKSPLAQKPWVRVGNRQVLGRGSAATVDFCAHHARVHAVFPERVSRARRTPVHVPDAAVASAGIGAARRERRFVTQPHFVLGDLLPHRNAVEADVPAALMWLELMARLGFLRRNENWSKLLDRFVDDCDRSGVWHPAQGHGDAPYHEPVRLANVSTGGDGGRGGALGQCHAPDRHHRSRRGPDDRAGIGSGQREAWGPTRRTTPD